MQEERWHDLPTSQTGQLPIEVIASEAFIASIAREGDSDMPPHELTHGMRSEKRSVSERLTSMLEEICEMYPGTGKVLHIERQMFATNMVSHLYGSPGFIVGLFAKRTLNV